MRTFTKTALGALLSAGLVCLGSGAAVAAPEGQARQSYIVTLKPGADVRGLAQTLAISPRYVYEEVLNGFAADLSAGQVRVLQRNPSVRVVELDHTAMAIPAGRPTPGSGGSTPAPPPAPPASPQSLPDDGSLWGLDRIDQAGIDDLYAYNGTGVGVTAYVIDTGIYTAHPDFGGRASVAFDNAPGKPARSGDCSGHGTHVAGTVGGSTYGVAKSVSLRAVRVLGCDGSGPYSGVIAGLEYVLKNHRGPSVANLSLSGPTSSALNDAVANLVDSGVFVAVAAGNDTQSACASSPSSTPEAMTVAAVGLEDTFADFSNFGACVDLAAPGVDITSAWLNGGTARASGTSMASPHVAGAAALYLQGHVGALPVEVARALVEGASTGVITGEPPATSDLLLSTGAA